MIETPKIEFFIGRITKVRDRETYEIEVEIPGYGKEMMAVPFARGEVDEPVEGNLVIILSVDPYHHNVNFYVKIKENNFIGFRSNGKVIDMSPDRMVIGSDGKDKTNKDEKRIDSPEKSFIKWDDDGNIEIEATKDLNITIKGGNTTIKSSTTVKVESPDVTITGGKLNVSGTVTPGSGPFCCLPNCLMTGSPHTGSMVVGT